MTSTDSREERRDVPTRTGPQDGAADAAYLEHPALIRRLDSLPGGQTLLICAPAGTGKTALAAHLLRQRETRSRWLTVTGQLDRPEALARALAGCTDAMSAGPIALSTTSKPFAAPPASHTAMTLLIDDAHLITNPDALAILEEVIRRLPPRVRLILCARFDPPLRWRALELDGRVERVGSRDLALTEAQTRELCESRAAAPTEDELARIVRTTEGWAAPVRIMADALAASLGERDVAMDDSAQPATAITEFLDDELLGPLPAHLREFLLHTSVPESFTVELAERLSGTSAHRLLRELEQLDFPLTRQRRDDQVWVRYHPLVRAHLFDEIRCTSVELTRDLHRRTVDWYDRTDASLSALPHLIDADDERRLVHFLSRRGLPLALDGAAQHLFELLDRAHPCVAGDRFVWVLRAVNALAREDADSAVAFLDIAGSPSRAADSIVPQVWSTALRRAARIDAATRIRTPGLPDLSPMTPVGHPDIDCYLLLQQGTATALRGSLGTAETHLHQALALAVSADHARPALAAVTRLAVIAGFDGTVTIMRDRARKALALAAERDLSGGADAVHATALAAFGAYLQGESSADLDVAALSSTREDHDGSIRPVAGESAAAIGQLLIFHDADDRYAAADALRRTMITMLDHDDLLPVRPSALLSHVLWALLHVREPRTARLLVEQARTGMGRTPEVLLARAAWTLIAEPTKARDPIDELRSRESELTLCDRVTAALLSCRLHTVRGQTFSIQDDLEHALTLAATEGLVRPFLDVPGTVSLLDERAGSLGHLDRFVERIRGHPRAHRADARTLLTGAEMTVLKYLPSGRTAQQVAEDLGISINTVKTHLRSIYAKLGANSRMAALDRARRDGLL
ncbi:helix-turn-helix transcriptional regulator [Nocardia jejuensis]|uniref:helix-turn-helix transcriptional regulator n=1 Tax=Nocardia jejuensis TaxID=328049 RepID=UPI0012FA6E9D|nr:LuxR C-terminal-related transcriptional regulator [Nocardia jejuensis]